MVVVDRRNALPNRKANAEPANTSSANISILFNLSSISDF